VPQQITFLLDGSTPIILPIRAGDVKSSGVASYNPIGGYASTEISENGIAQLTQQQYRQIISANSVAVQIQGTKRTVVFEASDISSSFVPNLRSFFEKYVQ
jgi:hypothetical protein